jgi:hypothetical protein
MEDLNRYCRKIKVEVAVKITWLGIELPNQFESRS